MEVERCLPCQCDFLRDPSCDFDFLHDKIGSQHNAAVLTTPGYKKQKEGHNQIEAANTKIKVDHS